MSALSLATGSVKTPLSVRRDDLYETPACAIKALLAVEPVPLTVWEPACGPGAIVGILRASGRAVVATDLVEYGCPDSLSGVDFLMETAAPSGVPAIVTNPPFKLAEEFVDKALDLVPEVYMLLRLAFFEGYRWHPRGTSRGAKGFGAHLSRVWVFAPRLPFMHRHDFEGVKNSNSGMPFAWFVFRRDCEGDPTVGWLNPRDYP